MSKIIQVSDTVYNRLKQLTNDRGGRDPKKISFSKIINKALDCKNIIETKK